MDAKRTVKTDMKFKDLRVVDAKLVDFETGEAIDLIGNLSEIYGDETFSLICTSKSEEILEVN